MSRKGHAPKTNAVRLLEGAAIAYELRQYEVDEQDLSAPRVAEAIGLPPAQVFKTLVARGDHTSVIFACIPGDAELDLKALAAASGNKKVELVPLKDVLPLTGYVRGGVSPVGAKKPYPLYLDSSAERWPVISVSAGVRGLQMLVAPGRPRARRRRRAAPDRAPGRLVPEVPHAGKHHRQAQPVRRRDHFRVLHRSARLNHRRRAVLRRFLHAIREREEGVRAHHRPGQRQHRLHGRDLHRIHAAHLPRADATLWPARAKTMAFDFTCFATFHANSSAVHSSSVGARFVFTYGLGAIQPVRVGRLRQKSAADRLHHQRIRARPRPSSAAGSSSRVSTASASGV